MKKVFAYLVFMVVVIDLFAQAPQKMSYQCVTRNSSGALVINQSIGVRISILQGTSTGTPVYVETQTPNTNDNGLVSLEIGGGTIVTGTFAGIDWSTGVYFIKTETDPIGGTSYNIIGTSQILSVPYALYAKTASSHYIGESYGGGIVFYVYDNGQHGLIAATVDQSPVTGVKWYAGNYIITIAKADGVGAGKSNTAMIIANQGYGDASTSTYAARICNEYQVTVGGVTYGDWYLPSKFELNLLYLQKTVVGGFTFTYYWSSTEYDTGSAWAQSFNNLPQNQKYNLNPKDLTFYVRAVRAF